MASKAELKKARLRRLRATLHDLDGELADLIFEKERLDDVIAAKRERKEETENRRQELKADIFRALTERKKVKAEIHKVRPRTEKIAEKVKKVARQVRNLASPKIVDLAFDRGAVRGLTRQPQINGSVGHYTAGPLDDNDAEAFELWRRYDAAHKAQGWSCLGYNIGITRDGTIVRLRGIEYIGAHTLNFNTAQVGISVHGTTGDTWTAVQRRALRKALKHYGLSGKPVIGHQQAPGQSTACPGSFLRGYITKGKSQ